MADISDTGGIVFRDQGRLADTLTTPENTESTSQSAGQDTEMPKGMLLETNLDSGDAETRLASASTFGELFSGSQDPIDKSPGWEPDTDADDADDTYADDHKKTDTNGKKTP